MSRNILIVKFKTLLILLGNGFLDFFHGDTALFTAICHGYSGGDIGKVRNIRQYLRKDRLFTRL